ncbi:hypothetical protein JZ751_007041 [Albula glossodonta]|uniref:Regulator of G-protein signaling 14 n=1 Tax=Albula glossodonta TaxID=121402 RepID=A0A8T2PDB3_9TELE|nr:hypothetical protein JZ751_007041 [Albula glossodonta]
MQSNHSRVGTVASWAVSFERLLEDPTGVLYFTAFLKSEVSAENILFWQACEKFRQIPANQKEELAQEACSIYNSYLSSSASNAINIDDTARTQEGDLEDPKPDMFNKAQQQIFKLMKFDSYTRFVRSQLYQNCMLADVEGNPLPDLGPGSKSLAHRKSGLGHSPSLSDAKKQKKKAKAGKSLPFDVETGSEQKRGTPENKSSYNKRHEKRGSWGAELYHYSPTVSRNNSQCSVSSTNSIELGYLSNKAENGRSSPRSSPRIQEHERLGTGRVEKYCCVFLPDGTASLCPAQSGLTIRDMLAGLCEKRGFPLSEVIIYLQTKDKQPLSLDQDSAVLRDQQVSLELRVTFTLEVVFTGKPLAIMVKSSKTLLHALSTVLQKHRLRPQDVIVTMSGSKEPLNLNMTVFSLANKRLTLDHAKGKDQSSPPKLNTQAPGSQEQAAGPAAAERPSPPMANRTRTGSKSKHPAVQMVYDMDGLIDLLSRAQGCRVDDQRGLLRKEDLVLPSFLVLPPDQCDTYRMDEEKGQGETHSHTGGTEQQPDPLTCTNHDPTTSTNSDPHSESKQPVDGPVHGKVETAAESGTGPVVSDPLTSSRASHAVSPSICKDSTLETTV